MKVQIMSNSLKTIVANCSACISYLSRHRSVSTLMTVLVLVSGSVAVAAHRSQQANNINSPNGVAADANSINTPEHSVKDQIEGDASGNNTNASTAAQNGFTRIDIEAGGSDTSVNINGQEVYVPENGSLHQTIPNQSDNSSINISVDSHTSTDDGTTSRASNTVRIKSSSKTTIRDRSSN